MTNDSALTEVPVRLDFDAAAPWFSKAISHLDHAAIKECDRVGLDDRLRELLRFRVSQINGCAYCVDMHSKDARAVGETEQRLYAVSVWRETGFFTDRERAALAFVEAMARMSIEPVPTAAYDAVAAVFEPDEIGAIVSLVVSVTAWNAVGVSLRPWQPGSYEV